MPTTGADCAPPDPAAADWTQVVAQLAAWLPPLPAAPDWERHRAWRWLHRGQRGTLVAVPHVHGIRLADLHGIDAQRDRFDRNIRQFIAGLPANHVLLTGARGCGKSSLVKAALAAYGESGLRVIELDKAQLGDLPDILELLRDRPEYFLLFCDDLSFDGVGGGWTVLKSLLDVSLTAPAANVLMVATSNRRHLMPDLFSDNRESRHDGDEIHPGEAIEEKISLSDRFGLWLSFYPMEQHTYLAIARHWAAALGAAPAPVDAAFEREALQWAMSRGSRSGRTAWQFARDWSGRQGLAG